MFRDFKGLGFPFKRLGGGARLEICETSLSEMRSFTSFIPKKLSVG